jgi:hypothetical protein
MRTSLVSLVWVSALVACSGSAAARRHEVEVIARIEARLAHAPQSGLRAPVGSSPPRSSGGRPATEMRPVVELLSDGRYLLDGRTLDATQLVTDLGVLRRHWNLLHPREPYPDRVGVWADGTMPLSEFRRRVDVVEEAPIVLVVDAAPLAPPPPCPEQLGESCAWLAHGTDRTRRDRVVAEISRVAFGSCDSLLALSAELRSADVSVRSARFVSALPTAARTCPADSFDVDALEVLTTLIYGDPEVYDVPLSELTGAESDTLAAAVARVR